MNILLLYLSKKEFFRTTYWKRSIGLKIFMFFLILYFSLIALYLGFHIKGIFDKVFPDKNPIVLFNEFVWGYFLISAIMRQLAQSLPTIQSVPLLTLPIKKRAIALHIINKSFFHIFNLIPWFLILPFAFTTIIKSYDSFHVLGWILHIFGLIMIDHLVSIWFKRFSAFNQRITTVILTVAALIYALSFYDILPFSRWFGQYLTFVLVYPFLAVIPILIAIVFYIINIKGTENMLYLDSGIIPTQNNTFSFNFNWTSKFGEIGDFIALELKMITRNKRAKTSLFSVIFLLLYGFIFYRKPEILEQNFMLIFIGILVTGSFTLTYGQFTPAWHSSYYPFIMCNHLGLKKMLHSQYFLFFSSIIISFIFSSIYIIYGFKILFFNFTVALFNAGVTSHLMLWFGSFSSKPIDLSQSSFMNYQGVSMSTWLTVILMMLGPLLYYILLSTALGQIWSMVAFGGTGLLGIIFHSFLMDKIFLRYKENKHKMIYAYKQ